ncbi:MAG TPA: GtrA family protein [Sphingomonas sp.]|nr:GtrA family protein [Sphingomonas sp.]
MRFGFRRSTGFAAGNKGFGVRASFLGLWGGLKAEHRALIAQIARYGVVGVGVTLFQIAIYNALSGPAHVAPLIANTIATAAAMLIGYTIHSRFTFQGHGRRDSVARTGGRFVAANLIGYALNSFWVWLFTAALHWPDWTPSLPMFFVTPGMLFWLNRMWVFD